MKIYVWEDLESVEYVSKKEDVYDENGSIVTPSLPLAKKIFLNQAKKIRNLLGFFCNL